LVYAESLLPSIHSIIGSLGRIDKWVKGDVIKPMSSSR
jgi:hypothetical protein